MMDAGFGALLFIAWLLCVGDEPGWAAWVLFLFMLCGGC